MAPKLLLEIVYHTTHGVAHAWDRVVHHTVHAWGHTAAAGVACWHHTGSFLRMLKLPIPKHTIANIVEPQPLPQVEAAPARLPLFCPSSAVPFMTSVFLERPQPEEEESPEPSPHPCNSDDRACYIPSDLFVGTPANLPTDSVRLIDDG